MTSRPRPSSRLIGRLTGPLASLRFYVALTCGRGTSREPPPDVALELCVRFRDRQVLRRACVSGLWGDAERDVPFFPFIGDQPFKVGAPAQRPPGGWLQ